MKKMFTLSKVNKHYACIVKISFVIAFGLKSFSVSAEKPEFVLEIKDHLFYPTEVIIPVNKKVKLVIYNRDNTPEEFDSFDLNREKVIFPNKKTTIFIGPLPKGRYEFFGEYNPNSARGAVIVKPQTEISHPLLNQANLNKDNLEPASSNQISLLKPKLGYSEVEHVN